ncbi:MAG: hypothetical protein ACRDWV_09470 [Acidimicrobiales bacterium]
MKLPIDTTGMTFLAAGPPEPVLDFETKQPKADENGEPIFAVQVVVLAEGGAEVIGVKVAGQPKGVGQGTSVRLSGLVASPWAMNDRSGVAFRASRIELVTAGAGPSRLSA